MKHRITPFLAFVLLIATATAQGEWKWAHYWTGTDATSNYTNYYNYITNTAFDDEGNLYVYGSMGNNPIIDGDPFEFCSQPMPLSQNVRSTLLAKFDTLGNMLWYKVVKSSEGNADALWMEVKGDRIIISGSTDALEDVEYYYNSKWIYYLDTLITGTQVHNIPAEERQFPFRPGRYTFFATLDKDGNLLENHFVEAFTRKLHPNGPVYVQAPECLCECAVGTCPFHVDAQGNMYIYTWLQYDGYEEDPYTIVVDGDTNRTYNLFLPGSTDRAIDNAMLYKFTPEWTLDFAHLLVSHTDGIATPYELTGDSINPLYDCFMYGLSFDDEDNMYLSGRIELGLKTSSNGGNLHNYPVHIWWDDSHCLTINDISSASCANFILKYNSMGQVVWSNQIYSFVHDSTEKPLAYFFGNAICDNLAIVCGNYDSGVHGHPIGYFELDTNNFVISTAVSQQMRGYIAAFEKSDGHYLFNTIIPNEQLSRFPENNSSLATCNNQIVSIGRTNQHSNKKLGVAKWGNTGEFLSFNPILSYSDLLSKGAGVATDGNGNLAVFMCMQGSMAFSENVYVNGSTTNSNAVIALYHDPELLVPYVKVPEYTGPKPEVRLWPNPATDKITIESEEGFPIKSVAVTDMQGQLITVLPGSDVRHTLNIHKLPAGTYIAHIDTKAGISDVKFVKGE